MFPPYSKMWSIQKERCKISPFSASIDGHSKERPPSESLSAFSASMPRRIRSTISPRITDAISTDNNSVDIATTMQCTELAVAGTEAVCSVREDSTKTTKKIISNRIRIMNRTTKELETHREGTNNNKMDRRIRIESTMASVIKEESSKTIQTIHPQLCKTTSEL